MIIASAVLASASLCGVASPSVGQAAPTPLPPPDLVFDNPEGQSFYLNSKYTGDSGYFLYTKDATVYRFDAHAGQNRVLGSGYMQHASVDGERVLIRRGSSLIVWQPSGDTVLPSPSTCDFGGKPSWVSENMRFVAVSCPGDSWVLVDVDRRQYEVLTGLGSQIVRVGNNGSLYYRGHDNGWLHRRTISGQDTTLYSGGFTDVVGDYGGAFVLGGPNNHRSFGITETGEVRPFADMFQPPPSGTGRYSSPQPIGDFLIRPDGTGSQCFGLAGSNPEGSIECFFGDHASGQGQYFVDAGLVMSASLDERWDWRTRGDGKIEVRRLPSRVMPSDRRCFSVQGLPGDAAIVNLTPVLAAGGGDGQLVSSDVSSLPVASNVNFRAGSIDPNVAIAKIGSDGEVCFVNSVHSAVHLIADHLGTIGASAYTPATASGAPDRRVDTRKGMGGGQVAPSGRVCFSVQGSPGDAAIVNLTPLLAAGAGDGQLVSSDVSNPPVASNVNFSPGSVDPNVAIAKIGAEGKVCFVNSVHASVHLVADHLGTIAASAYTAATSSGAPDRRVDTRKVEMAGTGCWVREDGVSNWYYPCPPGAMGQPVNPSGRLCFEVKGNPGDAAIVNLTPVLAEGAGDGQLVSSDVTTAPKASNVNYRPGSVDPNVAIAPIGVDGKVCYVNSQHTAVHLVADHLGTIAASAYTPATPTGAPDRRVDTRS